jgi:hypothetical protein
MSYLFSVPACISCAIWLDVLVFSLKEFIILNKCFLEELTTEVTNYKNEQVIEHMSVILIVGFH